MNKQIHILGGGTTEYIAPHLSLCAPAYGTTARKLAELCKTRFGGRLDIVLSLTAMASEGKSDLYSSLSVQNFVHKIKQSPLTKIVFFNVAIADFCPTKVYNNRLETRETSVLNVECIPTPKIVSQIRVGRKDIFLVAFKTTCGESNRDMYLKGLRLCKEGSCNLVLVNDIRRRFNMIVTPEEAAYCETVDRDKVLSELVDMTYYRSHLTFTRSTVISGDPVSWDDKRVPDSLRTVVNHCIKSGAYKQFAGATVGHFACKLSPNEFLTSIRKSNFNDLEKNGLVYVTTDGPDSVIAYGSKPSVGGQSQRIIFGNHPDVDCVVHFHCPLKNGHDDIPIRSQREVECGSHECGKNTSDGLKQFGNLKAVMLDKHGPNIVFNKSIDPQEVINFINKNFDLSQKTGGYNLE